MTFYFAYHTIRRVAQAGVYSNIKARSVDSQFKSGVFETCESWSREITTKSAGPRASHGTFAEAAAFGDPGAHAREDQDRTDGLLEARLPPH